MRHCTDCPHGAAAFTGKINGCDVGQTSSYPWRGINLATAVTERVVHGAKNMRRSRASGGCAIQPWTKRAYRGPLLIDWDSPLTVLTCWLSLKCVRVPTVVFLAGERVGLHFQVDKA